MREKNSPSTEDFLAVLHHVEAMEKQLDSSVKELGAMRQELRTAQEQNHPVKTALHKAVISAPFRGERSHFSGMKSHVEKSLNMLARLEERAAEKKPSIREALVTYNEKIALAQKDAPTTERPRPANAER